jgi:class 3 adenylate cyclase/tetratricopeptide (TPR) repeat protein
VTILFTDLSDSTHLSGTLEPETYRELLDELRLAFSTIVAERGGTTNQFVGDGLNALFGYPQPSEHDGRRATEAALAFHVRVRQLRQKYTGLGAADLCVHSGIHAGQTLARQGDNIAGRVEFFGPPAGIAKHLCDQAARDEILVSQETLGPSLHFFQTSERQVVLKGRAGALTVHRVLARTALRTRFEAQSQLGLLPFIGRQGEMARLDVALQTARAGQVQLLALCAPAGVGKTRLAEEFLRRAADAGCAVLRGYCEADLSAEPLQPFLQMLRMHLRLPAGASAAALALEHGLRALDPALLAHRGELLRALSINVDAAGAVGARHSAPALTLQALIQFFAALAHRAPLILFIDDWHWADDATRQVTHGLCQLADTPLLLLATMRPAAPGHALPSEAALVQLDLFGDTEAARSIAALLPGVDPFVADAIRRYAGGNPLFIEELCHSAARTGAQGGLAAMQAGSVWLETLIESRVSRLPPEQGEILSAAAVIGNVVPIWLLAELTGCDEHHPLVQGLADQDLLFPSGSGGSLRFKHGITREVVYGAVGLPRRRTMHRRIAQLFQSRTTPGAEAEACEALAYHHAGAADYALAAQSAEVAGDKAMATSSIDRAKTQYRAALEMLDRLPETPERYLAWRSVVRRLGMVSVFDPSRDTMDVFARAVRLARDQGDAAGQAYAEYWLAYVKYALGESGAAAAHCELALQAATALGDARLVGQVRAILGQARAAVGDYASALPLLDDAGRLQRLQHGSGRISPVVAYSLACKASVLGDQGHFDAAHACFEEALAALPGAAHEVEGSVLCWRSGVHLWQGDWQAARADAQNAGRVAERVKSLYLLGMSRGLGAYAAWKLGAGAQALGELADATQWLQLRDKNLFVSLNHGWLADALVDQGRPGDARHHAALALHRLRKRDWIGAAMASRAMARWAAAQGSWTAASRHVARAERVAAVRGSAHEQAQNQLCRARLALLQGQRAEARACLDRACEAFLRLRMAGFLAQAQGLLQAQGSSPEAGSAAAPSATLWAAG